jgi:hypothetical protein
MSGGHEGISLALQGAKDPRGHPRGTVKRRLGGLTSELVGLLQKRMALPLRLICHKVSTRSHISAFLDQLDY